MGFLRTLFLSGLLLLSAEGRAQAPVTSPYYADSLQSLVRVTSSDSLRARCYFLLSDYWSYRDSFSCFRYLDSGKRYTGSGLFLNGLYSFYKANAWFDYQFDSARKYYLIADRLLGYAATREAYAFQARSMQNIGSLYQREDNDMRMIEVLLTQALPRAERSGDSNRIGSIYKNTGLVYLNQFRYRDAKPYFTKALQYLDNSASDVDNKIESYGLAAENAINLNELPEAEKYLARQYELLQPFPQSEHFLPYHLHAGMYYRKAGKFETAFRHLNQALMLSRQMKRPSYMAHFQLHKLYAARENYPQALAELQEAHRLYNFNLLNDNRLHAQAFYQTYEKLGDLPHAYQWLQEFSTLQDSFYQQQITEKIAQLDLSYKATARLRQIQRLEIQQKHTEEKAAQARLLNALLLALGGLLLLALAFLGYYYRSNRRLTIQKEQNYQQHLAELGQQQKLAQTTALLEGAEYERGRLARDLHDGLGGRLAGIRMKLSGWEGNRQTAAFPELLTQLDEAVSELRAISRNLMPETLVRLGLDAALNDLCSAANTPATQVNYESFHLQEQSIDNETRLLIYRIVQEALGNALRYARASHILVQCSRNGSTFLLVVEDDGIGFDPQQATAQKGMGIRNIERRAQSLGGTAHYHTGSGKGTTLTVEFHV